MNADTTTDLCEEMESNLGRFTLAPDEQDRPLYHYTDHSGFFGIVTTGEVWATHYSHLNDREELAIGERVVQEAAESLVARFDESPQKDLLKKFAEMHEPLGLRSVVRDICVASFTGSPGGQ